jgi:hypothetical protein
MGRRVVSHRSLLVRGLRRTAIELDREDCELEILPEDRGAVKAKCWALLEELWSSDHNNG